MHRFRTPLLFLWIGILLVGCGGGGGGGLELVNVSYDPTRELYQDINPAFIAEYQKKHGQAITVTQSHGASGAQARAVIDGLNADVVTLALAGDIEALEKKGLIDPGWQDRLPFNSSPYTSTIVLVVRQGNPKGIQDWDDLVKPGIQILTPNPKTSGGARWNFLAAWGFQTIHQKASEEEATTFVTRLYKNVIKLDTGARGSTESFVRRKLGDVLIAWENEALLSKKENPEADLQIIYPSVSIRAEPPVAVVDKVVNGRKTRGAALEYLQFLYSDIAQDLIGKNSYRPTNPAFQEKYKESLPPISMFTLKDVAGDWATAQKKFFGDGGVFDQIYGKGGR